MPVSRLILVLSLVLGTGFAGVPVSAFGEPLDAVEQLSADDTFQYALEYNQSGTAASWHNPADDHSGRTTPLRTFQTAEGVYCREFQQTIMIDDQPQDGYGTACRQPDGTWGIVDTNLLRRAAPQPVQVTRVQGYSPPVRYAYPYPYWYYPGYLFFSFGYFVYHRHNHGGHHRYWRDRGYSGGRHHHRR